MLQLLDENIRPDYRRAFAPLDDPDQLLGPLGTVRLDADWVRDAALHTLFDWESSEWMEKPGGTCRLPVGQS